jgi:hypothetical protein
VDFDALQSVFEFFLRSFFGRGDPKGSLLVLTADETFRMSRTDGDRRGAFSLCVGQKIEYSKRWPGLSEERTIVQLTPSAQYGCMALEHPSWLHCTAPTREQVSHEEAVILDAKAAQRG